MAQYLSYNSVLNSKPSNEDVKRAPLGVLNGSHKFPSKSNKWQKQECFVENKPPESSTFAFPIFEDGDGKTCPSHSPALPECVTKLLTFNDSKNPNLEKLSKENEPSWEIEKRGKGKSADDHISWTCPYREDVYWYLKELETKFRPRPLYMNKQPDITTNMRSVLVDWLIEVGEEYQLQQETLHLAVSYTDRFLSQMSVLRGKLQLVGTAAMFIAAKHEEIYPPELKEFVYITDDTYTKKQILRMEHLILNILNFDLATPTAYTFLQLFCSLSSASEKSSFLAQYVCEISLLEAEPFLGFLPSQIGISCLVLANYILGEPFWSDKLAQLTGYCLQDVSVIVQCLYERFVSISSYPQQAVYEKYKSSKLHAVAEVECPPSLSIYTF